MPHHSGERIKVIRGFDFRTYEMAKLTGDDIASKNQDLGYFHTAIFKKSSDLQVHASCVTFASQDSVPPGSLYNVSLLTSSICTYYVCEVVKINDP